ncbi:DUF1837 domain-containing protein [Pseudomonas sp. MYb118]|uniref:DUF1837 domain-containing protein n=1 Tax=Pseudomonas sp. MYb118 TaxID=1848720 RepID=UPI0034D0070A
MKHPDNFLSIVFHRSADVGDDLALCAGFERGEWRSDQFADHVIEWLPEFALSYSEINEIGHHNALRLIKRAAKIVYDTAKYGSRGEFGEVLLHIAIRQVYQTLPAINKIYYKSSVNETVKGFDAVHVVKKESGLELWVGETKFYNTVSKAIYDVSKEIIEHLETDYLKSEFILIRNKIDPQWPEATELKELLHENTSLDKVFERACIPVLLTYDSKVVSEGGADKEYEKNIQNEVAEAYTSMRSKLNEQYLARFSTALPITVHVILIPLKEKKELVSALDKRLKALQI